jgi:hypothetical protein
MGQIINMRENELLGYEFTLRAAAAAACCHWQRSESSRRSTVAPRPEIVALRIAPQRNSRANYRFTEG